MHIFFASVDEVMLLIGAEIAKMHLADVVHGDLTTSNMMLRQPSVTTPEAKASLVSHLMLSSSIQMTRSV